MRKARRRRRGRDLKEKEEGDGGRDSHTDCMFWDCMLAACYKIRWVYLITEQKELATYSNRYTCMAYFSSVFLIFKYNPLTWNNIWIFKILS